ncbi:MAG: hypothetical protein HGA45_28590, partial [Chloroflexales bacterium]|nr:hypothetical protein [Chloroflexales bacterium]
SMRPDACEPNNTPERPCALPLDAVSGPFTIVPEDDQDFYLLDLPQEASIQTVVTVRATSGLDLYLTARQGQALLASGTFSLTLAPAVSGPVTLRVENRDPRLVSGESYRVEVRRTLVPPADRDSGSGGTADSLENNWSFETASPIAVGVVYDLTLVCPDARPGACPGGDHDYLLVPVKAGVTYLIATFDLDPGVDTVVEVFWQSATEPVAGSDDYGPGGMLAALSWTAPADGFAGIRVAPRNGGLIPQVADARSSYRLAVAPVASELARKLEPLIRQQAGIPTPTAAAASSGGGGAAAGGGASSGAPAGGGPMGSQETIAAGAALIIHETVLRREPQADAAALATLAPETRVSVRGPVSGLWISVDTDACMLPGWVRWSDLQRVTDGAAAPAAPGAAPTAMPPGAPAEPAPPALAPSTVAGNPSTGAGERVEVALLDPSLPAPPAPAAPRVPVAMRVVVVATDRPPSAATVSGVATPTPDLRQPLADVRVQITNVFGDVLAEGMTNAQGEVRLSRDVGAHEALRIRLPALGLEVTVEHGQEQLLVTLPEAHP